MFLPNVKVLLKCINYFDIINYFCIEFWNVKVLLKCVKYLDIIFFCLWALKYKSCNIIKQKWQFLVNNVKVLLISFKLLFVSSKGF